jgi:hydroxymethylbilane synthase
MQSNLVRLGTRGSLLAFTQSQSVATHLQQLRPDLRVELTIIKTTGDIITDRPLHDAGGKGLFTKELELALLDGDIDFAVHSYKDVPVTMPLVDVSRLVIAAVPIREDPRDVLVAGRAVRSVNDLSKAARVGTGSLRRQCQLLWLRPDLQVIPVRGNIDTRLKKQTSGEMDAVVLAAAGLRRAGLFDPVLMVELPVIEMVPAAAQGALALQCRADDSRTRELLQLMNDPATEFCTAIERQVIQLLNADCHSPIGVHAQFTGPDAVVLQIALGQPGSGEVIRRSITGNRATISSAIQTAVATLSEQEDSVKD